MIVCCGEALVDLVPEPTPGGGPMNAAIAASRLGAPAAFVGGLSTDPHGDRLRRHLRANGVDITLCPIVDAPTATARVEHDPELRFVFEGEGTADTLLEPPIVIDRLGPGPHVVHGGTLGFFRGRTADALAEMVATHDGIVSLDPNVRPQIIDDRRRWDRYHDIWLERAALYKASVEDLAWIWPDDTPEECAARLVDRGVDAVVITRGSDGLTVTTSAGTVVAPGHDVAVVDTVGAGDTVAGSLLADLWAHVDRDTTFRPGDLELADWERSARRAVAAAAVTCSRPGADPPFADELSG